MGDERHITTPVIQDGVDLMSSDDVDDDHELISDAVRAYLDVIFYVSFSGVIAFCGCVTNIINIIIFCKQGFNDTVNISLLGLAIADLGSLLTLVWMSICFNPLLRYSDKELDTEDVQYLSAGWPHVCFARITSWITAFVTFERCICIALPMKVKEIITIKRTYMIIIGIFIIMFLSVAPVFYAISIGPKYFQEYNKTKLGLVYIENGGDIENVSFSISVFAQLSSFLIVIICTIVLIQSLVVKAKWRRETANIGNSTFGAKDSMSSRDKRVVQMVAFISSVFIVCFMPSAINLILMICFSPAYSIVGEYQNTFKFSWSVLNTLEATNSSINIIIYYKMSSKYRAVFVQMFCCFGQQNEIAAKQEK